MTRTARLFAVLCSGALGLSLMAGCAAAPMMTTQATASGIQALKKPKPQPSPKPALQFVTIKAKVVEILPDDTTGLPHQNFVVQEVSPEEGANLTVNNDTKYGSEVPGLKVGMLLTIRGVMYHNGGGRDGIHWTHHKDTPDDAGYIQTPDGKIYQ